MPSPRSEATTSSDHQLQRTLLWRSKAACQPDEALKAAVILGHCTSAVREALSELIAGLRARGYELRTLTDVRGE